MKFFKWLIVFPIFFLGAFSISAQHDHSNIHDAEHIYHAAFGLGATKIFDEEGMDPGVHVHLLRKISRESNWSFGIGYEGIIGENWHNGLNLLLNYRPLDYLSFNFGPGIASEKENGENEFGPAFHMESVFEFNLSGIHLGPMVGFGIDKEDKHISLGVHIGFGM